MMNWITLAQTASEGDAAEPTHEHTITHSTADLQDKAGQALTGDTAAMWSMFETYGVPLISALVIIVITFIIAKILSGLAQRSSERAKIDVTLSRFFGKLIYYAVLIIGLMLAIGEFGVNVTSFAAILAAAGFAVGMAMSGTMGNFAAGAMLLIFRPFKVGDVVQISGITAKVNAIELFTTTMDTFDNRRMIIPNRKIYDDTIENISFHTERRMDVEVGAEYSADMDATRAALCKAAESLDEFMVKGEGRGYQVYLLNMGDSSINWVVRFWAPSKDCWAAKEKLVQAIKREMDDAGIGIPFPQMDVHLDKAGA